MCILFLNSRVPYLSIRAARKHSFSDWRICLVFTIDIFAIYVSTACPFRNLSFSLSLCCICEHCKVLSQHPNYYLFLCLLSPLQKVFLYLRCLRCLLSLTTLCCLSQFFPVSLSTLLFISAFSQFIATFPWLSQLSTFFSTVSCLLRLTTIFLKSLLYLSAVYCFSQISPASLLSVSSCLFLSTLQTCMSHFSGLPLKTLTSPSSLSGLSLNLPAFSRSAPVYLMLLF
jgi:hypothetical protein